MNNIYFTEEKTQSHIVNEEYFPFKLIYDSSIENSKFVGFYHSDTDLLEFTIDKKSNAVKKIQLVICSSYEIVNEAIQIPNCTAGHTAYIDLPQRNECTFFNVKVYNNGLRIDLNDCVSQSFYQCGNAVYGLSEDSTLCTIWFCGLSESNTAHIKFELAQN